MNELYDMLHEMRQDLQGIKLSLATLKKAHTMRSPEHWATKEEAMKMLSISLSTLNRLIAAGSLKVSKVNGMVYIKPADIDELLTTNYFIPKKNKNVTHEQ